MRVCACVRVCVGVCVWGGVFNSFILQFLFPLTPLPPPPSALSVFSGVTISGRVWRKVPESDARSVRDGV